MPDAFLDGLPVERRAEAWRRDLAGDELTTWVADVDGGIVGFAGTSAARDDDLETGTVELVMINVLEEHAGQGVGGALLATVEEGWRADDVRRAVLWVLESNDRARAVYEHLGWSPDGAQRDLDIDGTPVAELRLGKRIGREPVPGVGAVWT
jgi:GNAT superfamily N-acetyltransferase